MNLSVVGCVFVLDNEVNANKKKNDIKTLKVLINKETGELVRSEFSEDLGIKDNIRNKIKNIIGSDKFHLEQVYTLGEKRFFGDNRIDILYMGLTNINNIKKLDDNYDLVDFRVVEDKELIVGDNNYKYKTDKVLKAGSLEYYHKIKVDDIGMEKNLLEMMIVYKHLRSRMDSTDICFKLLPDEFTLEDVRIVYELIKDVKVDKSNFRKKIVKYCTKVDVVEDKKGYRPSQKYKFNPDSVKDWI
ncbi:MAG TPA: hypothetical protein DCE23_00530 [Firmicutes bacterium]|nr:hypothetical protein [Bacillota bacterium]